MVLRISSWRNIAALRCRVFGQPDETGDLRVWIPPFMGMATWYWRGLLHAAKPQLVGGDKNVLMLHVGGKSEGAAHRFEIELEHMNIQIPWHGNLANDYKVAFLHRAGEIINIDTL